MMFSLQQGVQAHIREADWMCKEGRYEREAVGTEKTEGERLGEAETSKWFARASKAHCLTISLTA